MLFHRFPTALRLIWAAGLMAVLACQTVTAGLGTATPPAAATNAPQATAIPQPTPPATPTPPPQAGLSRANPYPVGAAAEAPNWRVEVLEMVRGDKAWQLIREVNMFNQPAPEGQAYVAVRVRVTSTHTDTTTHPIRATDFRLTGDQLIRYFKATGVPPEPSLEAELRSGESAEGWTIFLTGAEEGGLILIFDSIGEPDPEAVRFLALEPGAAFVRNPALDEEAPTRLGTDLREPAALGATVITEDWALTIMELARGDIAYEMLITANPFNDPPAEGMEHIALLVEAIYLGAREGAALSDSQFALVGPDGTVYERISVVDPEPALDATFYPGGIYTGWLVLQAPLNEPVVLRFTPQFSGDYDIRYLGFQQ